MPPLKGTPEYDLWLVCIDIAADAPLHQGTSVSSSMVSWGKIRRLREALDKLDVDWRSVKNT